MRFFIKYTSLLVTAFIAGWIIGLILPTSFSFIIALITGGLIGWNWDKIWYILTGSED